MLGVIAFGVSIVAVIMSFFQNLMLASFAIAIIGIIIAITSAYDKDTTEAKEGAKKESRALEIGSIVISAAAIFSYFVFTILAQI
jgi:heme/copper-type cytochrome/quinol oxidase subunit 2